MVVHIGVIIVAVALVASTSYTHSARKVLNVGEPQTYAGHTFELVSVDGFETSRSNGVRVRVKVDDDGVYAPAISTFTNFGSNIPTPSVRTGILDDLYLTMEPGAKPGDTSAAVTVFVKPLIIWLWIGGALMVIGTGLAGFPGKRRRRPTDPTSAPIDLSVPDPAADTTPEEVTAGV
jgi:cytochrome c-type biogenesis protein CcmF